MTDNTIYAVGDIHGQKAMLDRALALIAEDGGPDAQIVFLGDYTDRGPNSRGVINTLIAGQSAGRNWRFIKGNHDRFFSHWVQFGREHDPMVKSGISWLNPRLGGTATLASYGVTSTPEPTFERQADGLEYLVRFQKGDQIITPAEVQAAAQKAVPQAHLTFLDNLPLSYETDDLLFVHAGIRPGVPLAEQDPEDLLWIREGYLDDPRDHGKLVVHGHTALDTPQHHGNRVNLDGGAGYGRPLIPTVFEGRDCFLLTPSGRQPLLP